MFIVDGEIRGEKELGVCEGNANIRDRERTLNNWLMEMGW
jgi:putative ABC transport system ATP-binding protein